MKKAVLLFFCLCCFSTAIWAQSKKHEALRKVLDQQSQAWNRGDLEGFMSGYLKSNELVFVGSKGLTRGWQATLDNYKKSYDSPSKMGKLTFTVLEIRFLSSKSAFMIGKWQLSRTVGDLEGHFSLCWKKIKGRWLIVADHSS